jgi:hypothetical protein
MAKYLHLDSEYRDRWEEFYLSDGRVEDSRLKNWREVEWEKVKKIAVHLRDKTHIFTDQQPGFKFFMNFRCGGREARHDEKGKFMGFKPINTWVVGWTDGKACFLTEMDFKGGHVIKRFTMPLGELQNHIHPRLKEKVDVANV